MRGAPLGISVVDQMHRLNNLRMLDACGVDIAGCSKGWSAEGLPRTIINADIDVVIARALAVVRGRKDLWGIRLKGVLQDDVPVEFNFEAPTARRRPEVSG